jgi:hypothetical protein
LAHLCKTYSFAQENKSITLSPAIEMAPTLLSAPIERAGNWSQMMPGDANAVIERMRHACLDGVRLLSERQPPTRLRVDEHRLD